MFIAALFTIAKLWKQPRCPTADEWIMKLWYIFTVECYSAIRNNDTWSEDKWMQLEDIMFGDVSQAQKDKRKDILEREIQADDSGSEKYDIRVFLKTLFQPSE
jgi:hypothetical protein